MRTNFDEAQKFFCRVIIRAFGVAAEAAVVKAAIKDKFGNTPKGALVDKTV